MNHQTNKNYFTEEEQSCPCCGENKFNPDTLKKFNSLRAYLGFALPANSMYRCKKYNEENGWTDTHESGQAGDIGVTHKQAYALVKAAPKFGFTGIGINQKGSVSKRFIHLDDLEEGLARPRPHIWSY